MPVEGYEIITRGQAKALGLSTYYTGKKCKLGHIAERFTANGDCRECNRIKSSIKYYKNKEEHCRKTLLWSSKNREKRRKINRDWARRNSDKIKSYAKKNPDIIKKAKKDWKKKNKEAVRAYTRNRRARLRGAKGSHTESDIKKLIRLQKNKCMNCFSCLSENGYNVDHVVALSLGGSNSPENLQILCPTCNFKKSNKEYSSWCRENGRLL